jgi:two-component system cell cycle response regulator
MVNADAEIASQVSDRARLAFAQGTEADNSPTAGRKVTASFGVSTVTLGASDIAELLNQADLALYESKHGGRNRVSTWALSDTQDRRAI